jgi:hypothetical protein
VVLLPPGPERGEMGPEPVTNVGPPPHSEIHIKINIFNEYFKKSDFQNLLKEAIYSVLQFTFI